MASGPAFETCRVSIASKVDSPLMLKYKEKFLSQLYTVVGEMLADQKLASFWIFPEILPNLANSDKTLKSELIEVLRISNLEMFRKLFLIIIRNSKYFVSTVYITLQPSDILHLIHSLWRVH